MKTRSSFIRVLAAVLTLSLLMLSACGQSSAQASSLIKNIEAEIVEGKAFDSRFGASQYSFAAELFRRSYAAGSNCLVSPTSVMLALAMTANGAAGETLQQMLDVLGSGMAIDDLNAYLYQYVKNLPSGKKAKLAIANSIWFADRSDFSVREDFLKKDVSWYGADIYKLPFNDAAVKEINSWVSKNTDKMINKIVQNLDPNDRMMLINAICFDAKWSLKYEKDNVADKDFTLADGSRQTARMMYSEENEYYEGEGYTGFAKYYEGGAYKFVGILPDEGTSLNDFAASLDGSKLSSILNKEKSHTKVRAGLPQFTHEYETKLNDTLQAMGMADAFTNAADFSPMSSDTDLYISGVVHRTYIEVNDEGTRAAAVTGVTMAAKSVAIAEPIKTVILDRPFLYMIVDSANNLPIFIGTVNSVE